MAQMLDDPVELWMNVVFKAVSCGAWKCIVLPQRPPNPLDLCVLSATQTHRGLLRDLQTPTAIPPLRKCIQKIPVEAVLAAEATGYKKKIDEQKPTQHRESGLNNFFLWDCRLETF